MMIRSPAAFSLKPFLKALVMGLAASAFLAAGGAASAAQGNQVVRTAQARPAATKATKATVKKVSINTRAKAQPAKKKVVRRASRSRGPSQATLAGLRKTEDPLVLGSSVAYVVDQDTGEELVVKNADVALPIASVTKLMTALVIAESGVSLNEKIRITREDYVRCYARSRLSNGMVMTRGSVLKAALVASDNRAAHALARTFPGGKKAFVEKMNEKAAELGMKDSFFADPTGLDNQNHSTARDLAKLVDAASGYKELRTASTLPHASLQAGRRTLQFSTTNRLIGDPSWKIGIQKTGFTTAAGRCMVVQSDVGDRHLVMVVLDSPNNTQRAADMRTMRDFVAAEPAFNEAFADTVPYLIF